jgi:hypothetical protein
LADPADFVRLEIEAALKRQIPVIPVLVEGASIPAVDRLPISLQGLSYRNGIVVRPDPDFHRDMDRLIEHLREQIKREQEGLSPLEVPHSARDVSLIIKMTSSEVEPRAEENVEAALPCPTTRAGVAGGGPSSGWIGKTRKPMPNGCPSKPVSAFGCPLF